MTDRYILPFPRLKRLSAGSAASSKLNGAKQATDSAQPPERVGKGAPCGRSAWHSVANGLRCLLCIPSEGFRRAWGHPMGSLYPFSRSTSVLYCCSAFSSGSRGHLECPNDPPGAIGCATSRPLFFFMYREPSGNAPAIRTHNVSHLATYVRVGQRWWTWPSGVQSLTAYVPLGSSASHSKSIF